MGHSPSNNRTKVEMSPSAVREDLDPEPESEKTGSAEAEIEVEQENKRAEITAKEVGAEGVKDTAKKSLSFKLAFIGLAASAFVFQLDATCLGIALPVSNTFCFVPYDRCVSRPRRLIYTIDHSWRLRRDKPGVLLGEFVLHPLRSRHATSLGKYF